MIVIKSKKAGFRRCGVAHPAEAVEYPDGRFTPAEIKILKTDPMLVVVVAREKAAAAPKNLEIPQEDAEEAANTVKAVESGKDPVKAGKKGKR